MCTLKIIGIDPVFFQPRHIEYALWVKNVAEVSRAPERVELSPGKNVNSYDHIFSRIA